ncbi:sensor histidine kinase [Synoicihabitans lomoniglobus]|uniref:histidine kinase n=1 Tax=Synoicihabitans lomoniglobus TaxID=2909285 RepID=A0AAE9ZUG8_9BACT|nr:ATP-binding protein [Opitutaceae bacterium LMO-M01]WED64531.1 ATP-binding protein [Opitutaceae bacterium LMO-M01]
MLLTITIALSVALLLTVSKLVNHRRALRSLRLALSRRQPFLRDATPGASGHDWDAFCSTANELITEVVTLKKQQSGQLTQLEATLGNLQEAVLVVDDRNHILLANNALQAIFPKATRIIDQRLEVVLHSVAFLNYVDAVRKGQGSPQHTVEFVDDTDTRWVEVTGSTIPSQDGSKGKWALFVLHDITRQKRLELVRKEFVANVSHELRTPLSVIKGYVETLVDGHHDMELSDRSRFLATIQRHTERLNSLLEDLLTLSRLESINPGLQRESTSLRSLVGSIVDDYRSRPAAQNHVIDSEIDPAIEPLLIDPLKLTQVFENLLDNALKYTPPGSTITIAARRRTEEVEIRVKDTGPGIPQADLPHIFERFYRVEKGRSREKGGTGLGLSIVKHIIQLHGGRVRAESQLNEGMTFVLTIPSSKTSN